MFVYKVGLDPHRRAIVILSDEEHKLMLPIVIGPFEARAIAAVAEQPHERPFTHELTNSIVHRLGYALQRVEVTKLDGGIFYALLYLADDEDDVRTVDARPSDAIALALYAEAPLFVAQEVLDTAALRTEEAEEQEKEELRDLLSGVFNDEDTP
jgi:bifunctional DNase/RNase